MTEEFEAPLVAPLQTVLPEWIDFNGHMNVAYYVLAFDYAVDVYLDALDAGASYKQSGVGTTFALQANVRYLRELKLNEPIRITVQLLDYSEKCTHYFMTMYHAEEDFVAATCEQINIHIKLPERRSAPFPPSVMAKLASMMKSHKTLGVPEGAGAGIGIRR